jgi:hypothetical protein
MAFSYRGNLVFGRVTSYDGAYVPISGVKPDNSVLAEEAIAGVPVVITGDAFMIATAPEGFYGIIHEITQPSNYAFPIVLAKGRVSINVRCITASGIIRGDFLTIKDGRFIKATAGSIVCGQALTDAIANGTDDILSMSLDPSTCGFVVPEAAAPPAI